MDVGNYTLLHLLGRGGTSEVYAAKHRERGDIFALKILQTTELPSVQPIQHPNVVHTIEVGRDGTSCYVVMELIEGEALAARLRRGPLPEDELRTLGAAIADGLQAAHSRGIVHRDLKPGNVMLRGDVPVIVDFGIAKSLGASTAAVTERRVGTVAYMAPEQLVDGLITPAVDIWALGVTLYEAATGDLPFKSFVDGRLPQLFEAAPRITTTSPAFADLVARCLERDPAKRPASMADLARSLRGDEVERVTADIGSTTLAPHSRGDRDGSQTTARRSKARWPRLAAIGAAVGTAAIATTMVIALRDPAKPAPITGSPAAAEVPSAKAPAVQPLDKAGSSAASTTTSESSSPMPSVPSNIRASTPPPKRAKPRPKKRTTSQGETLD